MNLLIFPEYAYPANHVVVNTVYETLLPERGHAVHMIRPMSGVVAPHAIDASWVGGTLIVYPETKSAGLLANARAQALRRRWLRQAVDQFDTVPLDAVLGRNDLLSAMAGLRIARRKGIPFIFQLSSPDAEFRLSLGRERGGLAGVIHRVRGHVDLAIRRRVMRKANVVLAVSDAMAHHIIASDGLDARRVFSFPMGVRAPQPLGPDAIADLRRRLGLQHHRTVVYSGVIDPAREPLWMLDVFDRVRAQVNDAVFLILTYQDTSDDRRRTFEAEVQRRGAHVKIVGPLAHGDVPDYLRCADVMFSPIPPVFEYNISSPTKSIEAMAVGLPVVGNATNVEHQTILSRSGGGIVVPWDQNAFADAIVSLLNNPGRCEAMGERGRAWVLQHRTYQHLTEYLEHIISAAGSLEALASLPHQPEKDSAA